MDRQAFQAKTRGIQIIVMALMMGLTMISGVLVYLQSQRGVGEKPLFEADFPLWPIGLGLLAINLVLASVIGTSIVSGGVKMIGQKRRQRTQGVPLVQNAPSDVDGDYFGLIVGRTIVANGLVEAAGVIGAVVYFLEGNPLALIVPGAAVLWMALTFPTMDRLGSEYEAIERRVTDEMRG